VTEDSTACITSAVSCPHGFVCSMALCVGGAIVFSLLEALSADEPGTSGPITRPSCDGHLLALHAS
jgi:hypothetical protein